MPKAVPRVAFTRDACCEAHTEFGSLQKDMREREGGKPVQLLYAW